MEIPLQALSAVELFRGSGAPVVKSAKLSSVSTQPPASRIAAVVLVSAGTAAEPSKQFAAP